MQIHVAVSDDLGLLSFRSDLHFTLVILCFALFFFAVECKFLKNEACPQEAPAV